ncbi:MAG: arginine deiminase family protein [Mycoplasmoidaceae bacterium]
MINVYSEIGKLKKVLVHTPGKEIENVSPQRLDELLLSALIEPESAKEEHKRFTKILKDNGIEVVQLVDLIVETFNACTKKQQEEFVLKWINESKPEIKSEKIRIKILKYLKSLKSIDELILKMMHGIFYSEIKEKSQIDLVVDPMPNLYFTRDPFASIGNGVSINRMKYDTRRRETIFSDFIFNNHPSYKDTPKYYNRTASGTIEGGDIFIYNSETLVIGHSERTSKKSITQIAKNIKKNKECKFKKIYVVNVPKAKNLMHLDTWLTMVDYDKFIYSPNMNSSIKFYKIDIKKPDEMKQLKISLESFLRLVTKRKPILIPVAGKNARQLDVDVETHFDATNYLVIEPGVVVGYSRNKKTEEALVKAGVKVLSFKGNQLSLGMGSARCMSMPLKRDDILDKK